MSRLPTVGGDVGAWGTVLNDFLSQSLGSDGTLKGVPAFNVKDPAYGATGNGVTDDAPAIQTALTAAFNAGGGVVYVPPGTYMLGSGQAGPTSSTIALLIRTNCALVGAGIGVTIFKTPATATSLTPIATRTGAGTTTNVILQDFTVDGNRANVAVGAGASAEGPQSNLYMDQVDTLLIERVASINAVNNGLYSVNSSIRVTVRDSLFTNNGKTSGGPAGGRGISVGVSPTLYHIENNTITGNLLQGLNFQNEGGSDSADNIISGNTIQSNGARGLDVTDNIISATTATNRLIHRLVISHNIIQANTGSGLRISENTTANAQGAVGVAQNIIVSANVIDSNTTNGVEIATTNNGIVRNIQVVGNQVRNNTTNGVLISAAAVSDVFLHGNLIAGNATQISDSGTRTIQGINKQDLTTTFVFPTAFNVNTITANAVVNDAIPKAGVRFRGSDGATQGFFNVSSTGVTRNSTGNYTLAWGTPFADSNYQILCSPLSVASTNPIAAWPTVVTSSGMSLQVATSTGVVDPVSVFVMAFGRQ